MALACPQPQCAGLINDGYCSDCGLAPAVQPATTSDPPERSAGLMSASRSATARSGRDRLGVGLVDGPRVQAHDPASAILEHPQVPEGKRFCARCDQPVGRSTPGRSGRSEGTCENCGATFSFRPRLSPGELVADQYEVVGCLAHGGLGWIYLARDKNVSDRWVVLKGLLNSGDADAQAAAVAERHFLAEVEHPSIVRIYNFVQHADSQTGEPAGYLVMEYVGGQSLRQIVLERRKASDSLPVGLALAYAIEVLPALGYLHRLGLVYCDFKPENVILAGERLKLIDMGGVRRIDDDDSPVYGTIGYQAPEIASAGPSPSSDLYTVGRALAVLTFEFTGYTGAYRYRLPEPQTVAPFASHESFYRLLRRATDIDQRRRFASATEMIDQSSGVLREVLSVTDGTPRPAFSRMFSPELQAVSTVLSGGEMVAALPVPLVDNADPAAGFLATLSALGPEQLSDSLEAAIASPSASAAGVADSVEVWLALTRARIALGNVGSARTMLGELSRPGVHDWRVTWYQGLAHLVAGDVRHAQAAFDAVCDFLPGELAPKLALAFTAEAAGQPDAAQRYFGVVWCTDRSYVSAAFGLARARLAAGDRGGAVGVLCAVPESSAHWTAAQVAAVRAHISGPGQTAVSVADVLEAGSRLERLSLDASLRHTLAAEVLRAGLATRAAGAASEGERLLNCELTDRGLREGLERCYRSLARLATTRKARYALVDLANSVRPRTLV